MQSSPPARRRLHWSTALCLGAALAATQLPIGAQGRTAPPDESRFTRRVLVEGLDEPINFEFEVGQEGDVRRGRRASL